MVTKFITQSPLPENTINTAAQFEKVNPSGPIKVGRLSRIYTKGKAFKASLSFHSKAFSWLSPFRIQKLSLLYSPCN